MQVTINNETFEVDSIGNGDLLRVLPKRIKERLGERELLALEKRIKRETKCKNELAGTFDVINQIDSLQAYAHFRFTK